MLILQQGSMNDAVATCSRNKNLTGTVYFLWTVKHKLSNQSWQFIPYRNPSIVVGYEPSYDLFNIEIDLTSPEVYIGTGLINANLHLIAGEYYLKIYEQTSPSNLNPSLSYDVVYEGIMNVLPETPIGEISYSGNSNIFIIYNG